MKQSESGTSLGEFTLKKARSLPSIGWKGDDTIFWNLHRLPVEEHSYVALLRSTTGFIRRRIAKKTALFDKEKRHLPLHQFFGSNLHHDLC